MKATAAAESLKTDFYPQIQAIYAQPRKDASAELEEATARLLALVRVGDLPPAETLGALPEEEGVACHAFNVGVICALLSPRFYGDDDRQARITVQAGFLHDLGIALLDNRMLAKGEGLNPNEKSLVRQHPVLGRKLLLEWPGLDREVIDLVVHHHERPDGSGYPDGLLGGSFHPGLSLLQLADCFDALTSHRPHTRRHTTFEAVKAMIQQEFHDLDGVRKLMQELGRS